MAGPVVTTLLSPNPASGTWAPSDNVTETTLASSAAASGTFVLRMDVNTQVDGDVIVLRVYSSADASNERLLDQLSLGPLAPTNKMILYGPIPTAEDIKFTALLSVGSTSSRSFPWTVINLNGT